MSIYGDLPKKVSDKKEKSKSDSIIRKTLLIDDVLYEQLRYLSDNIYDVSINKLVTIAIDNLIQSEDVKLYVVDYKISYLERSYLIPKELLEGLEKLKEKYTISVFKLVNIAVYNALKKEG